MNTIKEFYELLIMINNNKSDVTIKADDASDLMLDLQDFLINKGVIDENLFPLNVNSDIEKQISDIFLDIRRKFQNDDEQISDFSYLMVADKWLLLNDVKLNY